MITLAFEKFFVAAAATGQTENWRPRRIYL